MTQFNPAEFSDVTLVLHELKLAHRQTDTDIYMTFANKIYICVQKRMCFVKSSRSAEIGQNAKRCFSKVLFVCLVSCKSRCMHGWDAKAALSSQLLWCYIFK